LQKVAESTTDSGFRVGVGLGLGLGLGLVRGYVPHRYFDERGWADVCGIYVLLTWKHGHRDRSCKATLGRGAEELVAGSEFGLG
jgi:hypothetical protein